MKFSVFSAIAALATASACATTDNAASDATPAGEETVKVTEFETFEEATKKASTAGDEIDRDRVICRRQIQTGTRFAKKTCRTLAEWQRIEQNGQRGLSDMQRGSTTVNNPQGG